MHDGGMRKVTAFSGMMIARLRMLAGIRRKRQAWEQGRCPKLCGLFHIFGEVAKGDEL